MSIPQKAKGTDLTSLELVSRHEIGSVLTYDPLSGPYKRRSSSTQ